MGFSKKPAFRLPSHLQHLKTPGERSGDKGPSEKAPDVKGPGAKGPAQKTARGEKTRGGAQAEPAVTGGDRVGQVLPVVLRAALGDRLNVALPHDAAEPLVPVEALLAALAPYHRPKSRFEMLVMRRLVGEGYLRPRGARDKYGFSGQYAVTRKGEKLAGMRRGR